MPVSLKKKNSPQIIWRKITSFDGKFLIAFNTFLRKTLLSHFEQFCFEM